MHPNYFVYLNVSDIDEAFWTEFEESLADVFDDRSEPCGVEHLPVDTGLRWSYCKHCNVELRFENFEWKEIK